MTIRVLLTDDQALLRATFRILIDSVEDMAVVAEAADGQEALDLADIHRPDVILMDLNVAKALRAGASGFLGKGVSPEVLLAGIRTVAAGDALLSPAATRSLITRFLATPEAPEYGDLPAAVRALTEREREVMALAAHGRSDAEIAGELVLSPLTVRSHIQRAMTELDARDRAQLVVMAYRSGLVKPGPDG
ncbi:response regulator transcription factor [Streptomyces sp. YKOK-I1]